jgi:STE24 endopeptidase
MRVVSAALGFSCAVLLLGSVAVAGPPGAREEALKYFTPEEITRGKSYMGGRYLLFGVRSSVQVAFLLLLVFTPVGRILRDGAAAWAGHRPWLTLTLYATCLVLFYRFLLLPVDLYGGYVREHVFGLSTQRLGGWFMDWGKGALIQLVLLVPTVHMLYVFIRRDPFRWFLPAGVVLGGLILLFTFLAPVLVDPLFHTFRPLENPALKTRIVTLAERAGIPVEQILVADASRRTVKANAYVTGFGRTKRIVLYDTLLERASPEEVEVVLAHEIGHRMHHHIWKGVGLSILSLFAGLGVAAIALRWGAVRGLYPHPADFAGLPVLLLTLFALSLGTLPLQNAISRRFEREADRAALSLTENREAYVRVEVGLARSNLADVVPPRWAVVLLYTHPPVLERIAIAEAPPTGRP